MPGVHVQISLAYWSDIECHAHLDWPTLQFGEYSYYDSSIYTIGFGVPPLQAVFLHYSIWRAAIGHCFWNLHDRRQFHVL